MIRLTNNEHEWYDDYARCMEDKYDIHEVTDAIYKKLKCLEDIEEKLGIDLITLFKATQQGIWMKHNNAFYFFDNLIVDFKRKCLVQIVSDDEVETFPFDSYGEDWGLSREELE